MLSETLEQRLAAVGARVKVADAPWRGEPRIDEREDARLLLARRRFDSCRRSRSGAPVFSTR